MLSDPRARATWRLFRMRAEWMLGSISHAARKELLSDLEAHVRDAVAEAPGEDERAKLAQVLDQLGDPREFLAPLVAEAVFKRPRPVSAALAPLQAVLIAIHAGARQLVIALMHLAIIAIGLAFTILGAMRTAMPKGAGVFRLAPDDYQVRLLGRSSSEGLQVLPAWAAGLLVLAGIAIVIWSLRSSRRQLTTFLFRSAQ